MRLPIFGEISLGTGILVGAAVVFLAPVVLPAMGGVLKSLTKAGIKGGLILYEQGKVAIEEARESVEDLVAEAKAELSEAKEAGTPVARKKAAATT